MLTIFRRWPNWSFPAPFDGDEGYVWVPTQVTADPTSHLAVSIFPWYHAGWCEREDLHREPRFRIVCGAAVKAAGTHHTVGSAFSHYAFPIRDACSRSYARGGVGDPDHSK